MRILEDIQDMGSVLADGVAIEVTYRLQAVEDDAGVRQLVGRIDVVGEWMLLYKILAAQRPITLRLAGGCRIDFEITAEGEALGSASIRGPADR